MVQPETAGDPTSEQKWVRSSLRHLSERLKDAGHPASPPTVARLLRKLGYCLRVNAKKREASSTHPDREAQLAHWWEDEGRQRFPQATHLLILADAGGSNGTIPSDHASPFFLGRLKPYSGLRKS